MAAASPPVIRRKFVDGRITCPCGCMETPKGKKSTFCMGHDARLRERLIGYALEGVDKITLAVQGEADSELSPVRLLDEHGWGIYRMQAEQAVEAKCASLVKKAKANPRLEKLGKTDQYPVVAVYSNKNGSRDVESIDRRGHKHWRHLPTKEEAR